MPSLILALLLLLRFQVSVEDGIVGFGDALPNLAQVVVRQKARMPAVLVRHRVIMSIPVRLSNGRGGRNARPVGQPRNGR